MKKSSLVGFSLLFTLIFSLLLTLVACAPSSSSPQVVTLDASWAEYYTSLSDLKQHSDIAVRGTISYIAPTVKPANGPVYSMVTVKISQAIWNRHHTPVSPTITFEQTGGTYNHVTYQVSDDPLFHVGDQVILFFKEYSPGKYRISGGPTGRFSIQNGVVRPIVSDGVKLSGSPDASHFAAELQAS
ncbi:MAG TPA: hypothetical protein VFV38_04775 [Ktedonobacteraceae bacterium]|nr:hypothetical protein [Ktedonobacteraceae bacterium]